LIKFISEPPENILRKFFTHIFTLKTFTENFYFKIQTNILPNFFLKNLCSYLDVNFITLKINHHNRFGTALPININSPKIMTLNTGDINVKISGNMFQIFQYISNYNRIKMLSVFLTV